jgi:hypothetical protein
MSGIMNNLKAIANLLATETFRLGYARFLNGALA